MTNDDIIRVPLGDTTIEVSAPPGWKVSVAEQQQDQSPLNPAPTQYGPPLVELAQGAKTAIIAYTDATRACPDSIIIPPLIEQLREAGLPDEGITLLCAVGMHRASTHEENVAKLGADIVDRYHVINHDPNSVVTLGDYEGVPLTINPLCLETDLLLATGIVEPHHYAGWSGGGKTVAIGCAGPPTIAATHSPRFLDDDSVRLGRVAGNFFQELVRESARRIGLKYVANVGLNKEHQVLRAANGAPETVHDKLVEQMSLLYETPVAAPFDVVIAGVGHPKDVNLYQASRAATYIGLSQHTLVRAGGIIILPATCPEGAGQGVGEQNFLDSMSNAADINSLLDRLKREGCRPGEQRAFILGKVLRKNHIIVVGAQDPDIVRACHMTPAADMQEAIDMVHNSPDIGPEPEVLVVPQATQTLPVPTNL